MSPHCSPTSRCPGPPRRDADQRGRPGNHVRRRMRGARARGSRLPDAVQERLREFLPPEASLANPVDMIATANAEHYRHAISTLAAGMGSTR